MIKILLNSICILLISFTNLSAEDLVIPVMVGQTGASSIFGKPELDAYTLAIEEWNLKGGVNGQQISLAVEDTQTNQRQILSAFHKLAIANPPAILGPTWLDGFQAVIPLANKKDIMLITPSAARESFAPENSSWPITFYHNSTQEIKTLIGELQQQGMKNIALIYQNEPFAEMVRKLILQNNPELVADYGAQAGETDFNSLLLKLKQKNPDVLIILIWDEHSLLSLLRQIRITLPELKLATVHDGEGWLKNSNFKSALPQLIYSKFVIIDSSFAARFEKRFGYQPLLTASNAYDAINSLLQAYQAGNTTATAIRNFLLSTELTTTTFGKFKLTPEGTVPSKVIVINFPSKSS